MSIKLTYGLLRKEEFIKSFGKLSRHTAYHKFETTHRIYKLGKELDSHLNDVYKLHTGLVMKFAKKDEEGKLVPRAPDHPGTYVIEEKDRDEWMKALEEFDATEVTLEGKQVKVEHLDGLPISPADLEFLEPLIQFT